MTDDFRGAANGHEPARAEAEPSAHPTSHDASGQPGDEPDQAIPPPAQANPGAPAPAPPPGQGTQPGYATHPGPQYGPFHSGGAPQEPPTPAWSTDPPWPATQAPPQTPGQPPPTPTPISATPHDPYGLDPAPWDTSFNRPRIEPSPPPNRGRLVLGLLAGLTCGLLLFGSGGFIAGRFTANPATATPATAKPTPTPSLPIYEQSQVKLNQPKFPASLTPVSQGWLPYVSGCARSGQSGGPTLNAGEKVRVRCTLGGMSAIFVEYDTVTDRDKARVAVLGQNVDARTLTPGVAAPTDRSSPSGRTSGNYVEYAFKVTERGTDRTVSGIRWEDAQTPVAGYLLAFWVDGVGSNWAPMRDLWARYA